MDQEQGQGQEQGEEIDVSVLAYVFVEIESLINRLITTNDITAEINNIKQSGRLLELHNSLSTINRTIIDAFYPDDTPLPLLREIAQIEIDDINFLTQLQNIHAYIRDTFDAYIQQNTDRLVVALNAAINILENIL